MMQEHGNINQQNDHDCQTENATRDIPVGHVSSLRSVLSLHSVSALDTFLPSGCLEKATLFTAAIGAFSALACTAAGYVWAGRDQDDRKEKTRHQSACILNQLNFDEALAIAPWNLVSPPWIACVIFIVGLIVRKYLLPLITNAMYYDLTDMKKEKVSNYMLEILGTTAALLLLSLLGFWELLFEPEAYLDLSADQAYNLALGGNILICMFVTTYLLELACDKHMRFGLVLHHWTVLGLMVLTLPALYKLGGDIYTFRACFCTIIVHVNRTKCLHRNADVPPASLLATPVLLVSSVLHTKSLGCLGPESMDVDSNVRFGGYASTSQWIGIFVVAGTPPS